jgi:hypothetical protein
VNANPNPAQPFALSGAKVTCTPGIASSYERQRLHDGLAEPGRGEAVGLRRQRPGAGDPRRRRGVARAQRRRGPAADRPWKATVGRHTQQRDQHARQRQPLPGAGAGSTLRAATISSTSAKRFSGAGPQPAQDDGAYPGRHVGAFPPLAGGARKRPAVTDSASATMVSPANGRSP